MKHLLIVAAVLMLTGCTATPVKRTFPDLPPALTTACEAIDQVPNTKKLSVVLTVVTQNYAQYQECSIKVDTWRAWYDEQKKIFESVK
jgi:uncharacterized lipoprotein YajG